MKQKKELKNISASVKERLRNISVQSGKEFQSILRQYIQERFLFRLSKSIYSNNLILKGALLFVAHDINRSRPTKDIDFLGSSLTNEKDEIAEIISEILNINYEDGFKNNPQKQIQWASFLQRNKLNAENDFAIVVDKINSFIDPIFSDSKSKWNPNKFVWE